MIVLKDTKLDHHGRLVRFVLWLLVVLTFSPLEMKVFFAFATSRILCSTLIS